MIGKTNERRFAAPLPPDMSVVVHNRHFTLVELLVVVGIIAILLALLLPSLRTAMMQAQALRCLNNEKQLAVAFNSYLNDYNDWFPPAYYYNGGNYLLWRELVAPYVSTDNCTKAAVFRCSRMSNSENSYAVNRYLMPDAYPVEKHMHKLHMVVRPGKLFLMFDGSGLCSYYKNMDSTYPNWAGKTRHNNGGNYLFIDGHAEWLYWSAVLEPGNPNHSWFEKEWFGYW